jgi:hypothetical protein
MNGKQLGMKIRLKGERYPKNILWIIVQEPS